jgi:hypothetical protein
MRQYVLVSEVLYIHRRFATSGVRSPRYTGNFQHQAPDVRFEPGTHCASFFEEEEVTKDLFYPNPLLAIVTARTAFRWP